MWRDRYRGIENEMSMDTKQRIGLVLATMIVTSIACSVAMDSDPPPTVAPASVRVTPPPMVVQTDNPEVIKQLGEMTKMLVRLNTEIEAIKAGERPGTDPGTLMLMDPQTGVAMQTNEKKAVRITGNEVEIFSFWRDGKYISVPILYGAENIPPPTPPTMEMWAGGQRTDVTFPSPNPRRRRSQDGDDE